MLIAELFDASFNIAKESRFPWLGRLWIGGLIISGLLAWGYFFGWLGVALDFHDWADINVPRLTLLQNALKSGTFPWHMADTAPLHGITDRFLALPDVITSPQTLLLTLVDVRTFVLIDVMLQYAVGAAGLVLLRRRLEWSLFTFSWVFVLFGFNGHILSHYTVGHFTWGAYFLLPLVFLFVFRFLDGESGWRWVAGLATVLFYMTLAGGQHHVTWVLIFLGLMIPFCWSRAAWLVAAGAAAMLLSAARLLPPALELRAFDNTGILVDVLGYPSVSHLVWSMVDLRREHVIAAGSLPGNLIFFDRNYWEFNFYVGAVGFAVIAAFGLYRWLRASVPVYRELIVPTFVMVALSLGSMYRLARMTAIPLLQGERITSRMVSVPLVLLIIMAGVQLQTMIRDSHPGRWTRIAGCCLLGLLVVDVSSSIRLLRLAESARLFGSSPMDLSVGALAYRADPGYVTIVAAGAAITAATAAALWVLCRSERAREHSVR